MSFTVTTPIYYVNGAPHLGHAYTTIAADVLARHHRQRGEDVFFLTGTDEHGEPVALAAEKLGVTPQELADTNAERFKALAPLLDASNDFFIRTTDPEHKAGVQAILQTVKDNGYVELGRYEGWYCPRCADFKNENEVEDGDKCAIHHIVLTRESEENWFFKLSAFQERLEALYAEQPEFVLPRERRNEALAFIEGGLQDVSLSRGAKLQWGVQVPWDPEHVFYVWFDAPIEYIGATEEWAEANGTTWRDWWRLDEGAANPENPVRYVQFMGKDNVAFHTVSFPATILGSGEPWKTVDTLKAFNWLNWYGGKFSTSQKRGVFMDQALEILPADYWRWHLTAYGPEGSDAAFTWEQFQSTTNKDLADVLGNFVNRILKFTETRFEGVVPAGGVDGHEGWLVHGADRVPVPRVSGGHVDFYAAVGRWILDGGPVPVDPEDAVRTAQVLEAAVVSAREGRVVRLD